MINATQMAKPFKKLVGGFLRLQSTKEYIALLEARYANLHNDKKEVLRVVRGGTPALQGTWVEEKLALKFAAWLSPSFELWVYDKIQELITTGKTQISDYQPSGIIQGLRLIVQQLEEQEQFNQQVREQLEVTAERLDEIEAKITSIDESYYTVSGFCALHGIYCPVDKARKWGYTATKLSNQKGIIIGKAYDEKYGQVNTYHQEILQEAVKE